MVLESHRNPCNSSSSSSIYCSRLSISTESVVIVIDKPGIYFSGAETRLAARLGRRRTAEHFRHLQLPLASPAVRPSTLRQPSPIRLFGDIFFSRYVHDCYRRGLYCVCRFSECRFWIYQQKIWGLFGGRHIQFTHDTHNYTPPPLFINFTPEVANEFSIYLNSSIFRT